MALDGCPIACLGRADLIANKRATGRTRDLADVELLEAPKTGLNRGHSDTNRTCAGATGPYPPPSMGAASETMKTDEGKGRAMNVDGMDEDRDEDRDKAAEIARGGERRAEVRLPSRDLHEDLSFFGETLGFRLDSIFPADDPAVAVMSGHGLRLRLERGVDVAPGAIRILCDDPAGFAGGEHDLVAPNGARIEIRPAAPALEMPPTRHDLLVQRSEGSGSWGVGRAGNALPRPHPGALGRQRHRLAHPHPGRRARAGHGALPCRRVSAHLLLPGWVRVVYEDQGPPFTLDAGDCLIQPPEIRHRVLESSANAEGDRAGARRPRHPTMIDHALTLPRPCAIRNEISAGSASVITGGPTPSGGGGGSPASRLAAPASPPPPAAWRMRGWPDVPAAPPVAAMPAR